MTEVHPFLLEHCPHTLDEIVGNEDAKDQVRAWTTFGFPRAISFEGDSGCGKTTISDRVIEIILCSNRATGDPNPCFRDDCICKRAVNTTYISFGQGVIRRDASRLSVKDAKEDFDTLAYVYDDERPVVIYYDEIQQAPERVRAYLLKRVEERDDWNSYVFIISTWATDQLETPFLNRFSRVKMRAPTESQMLEHLRKICTKAEFPLNDQAILEICRNEDCVPRNCLIELEKRGSLLKYRQLSGSSVRVHQEAS